MPLVDPISSLPKTAQKILTAARKLLIEGGYEAMTLENVAGEAGVQHGRRGRGWDRLRHHGPGRDAEFVLGFHGELE